MAARRPTDLPLAALPAREITRRLNRKFGAGTFRSRKERCGWPNRTGEVMFEVREGRSWSFVAYDKDRRVLGREIRGMRDSGYLVIGEEAA